MIKNNINLFKIFQHVFCSAFLLFFIFNPVLAEVKEDLMKSQFGLKGAAANFNPDDSKVDIAVITGQIVGVLLSILGVIFLGLIIYGGFLWMLARGNDAEVQKGKDIVMHASIGIIIVFVAYVISNYIIQMLTQIV